MALLRCTQIAWGCWLVMALGAACGGNAFHVDHDDQGGSSGGGASATGGGSSSAAGKSTTAGRGGNGGADTSGTGGTFTEAGATPAEAGQGGSDTEPQLPPISTTSLVYWFRADAGVTETSGRISKWADQSGNGQDALQQLPTQRPKLTTTDQTPLPLIEFDGESVLELPSIDAPIDAGMTFFAVAGRGDESGCSAFLELSNGEDKVDVHFGHSGEPVHFEVENDWYDTEVAVFPVGALRQVTVQQSADVGSEKGAKVEVFANGAFIGLKGIPFPVRLERTRNFIGQSAYPNCHRLVGGIGELVLYSRVLPAAERAAVESYLKAKWQLDE